MHSDNGNYYLLEKLVDESCDWWDSYTEVITEDDIWDEDDTAVLAIAYLVESGRLTYEDVAEATKAFKRCADYDIGKACFIDRIMKDAVRERGESNR